VLISGVLFRNPTQLSALCVTCPHEQCQVDLVTDTERLARMSPPLRSGQARGATHPLFECGCHFSVFDAAADGARISGESPRGLYRFRIGGIRDGSVEITDIEEAALSEV
jgi:Rieske Fe-S protein